MAAKVPILLLLAIICYQIDISHPEDLEIILSTFSDNIERIELPKKSITAINASNFARFTNLTHLDLSNNLISEIDRIAFIGALRIDTLILCGNLISKFPKESLAQISSTLTRIKLSYNNISIILVGDVSDLSVLKSLDLSKNQIIAFHDILPASLRYFYVRNNPQFSIMEPAVFSRANDLTVIYAYGMALKEIKEDHFNSTKLRTLHLAHNEISYIHPKALRSSPNLTNYYIYDNNLTQNIPTLTIYLTNVLEMQFQNNKIMEMDNCDAFINLPNVETLSLSHNIIPRIQRCMFRNNPLLTTLFASSCDTTTFEEDALEDFPHIDLLHLMYQRSLTKIPNITHSVNTMKDLRLGHSGFPEADILALFENYTFTALTHINLRSLGLSRIPRLSPSNRTLRHIDLRYNKITQIDRNLLESVSHDGVINFYMGKNKIVSLENLYGVQYSNPIEKRVTVLHLNGNPIHCNCSNIHAIHYLRNTSGFKFGSRISCKSPSTFHGICAFDISKKHLKCSAGQAIRNYSSFCYFPSHERGNWSEMNNKCQLARVYDQNEKNLLLKIKTSESSLWMYSNASVQSVPPLWADGRLLDIDGFAVNGIARVPLSCMATESNLLWKTAPCSTTLPGMCEIAIEEVCSIAMIFNIFHSNNSTISTNGTHIEYTCSTGTYLIDGSKVITLPCDCTIWQRELVTKCCRPECPPTTPVSWNISPVNTTRPYFRGDHALYMCPHGHLLDDGNSSFIRLCLENKTATNKLHGMWNKNIPHHCHVMNCTLPVNQYHATYIYNNTSFLRTLVTVCDQGYIFDDNTFEHKRTCQLSNHSNYSVQWTDNQKICKVMNCTLPVNQYHAIYIYNNTSFLSTLVTVCDLGYIFDDNTFEHERTCQLSNHSNYSVQWTDNQKICRAVTCNLPNLTFASSSSLSANFSQSVLFTCDLGFFFPTTNSNTWNSTCSILSTNRTIGHFNIPPDCQEVVCPPFPSVSNATITTSNVSVNTSLVVTCLPGFVFPDGPSSAALESPYSLISVCQIDSLELASAGWSVVPSNCTQNLCPKLNLVSVSINTTDRSIGTTLNVFCEPFSLIFTISKTPSMHSKCLYKDRLHSEWWPPLSNCTASRCNLTALHLFARTTHSPPSSDQYGTLVTLKCDVGTEFNDGNKQFDVICGANDKWEVKDANNAHRPAECNAPVSCPPLQAVPNTILDVTTVYVSNFAVFTCAPGWEFDDGSTTRSAVCLYPGKWSQIPSPCTKVKPDSCSLCGRDTDQPKELRGVSITADTITDLTDTSNAVVAVGSTVLLSCPSYTWIGTKRMHFYCNFQKEFSPPLNMSCPESGCPAFAYFDNTILLSHAPVFHATCRQGYRFYDGTKSKIFDCSWDYDQAECHPLTCPPLQLINSVRNSSRSLYNSIIQVTCNDGFLFDNYKQSEVVHCQASSLWNKNISGCLPLSCAAPEVAVNGNRSGSGVGYLSRYVYQCDRGRRMWDGHDRKSVVCTRLGRWSSAVSSCGLGRCPPVPEVAHASGNSSRADGGAVVEVKCHRGFVLPGRTKRQIVRCSNGTWTPPPLQCQAVTCATLANSRFARFNSTRHVYPEVVLVSCLPGFVLPGEATDTTVRCADDGSWQPPNFNCTARSCGQFDPVFQADRSVASGSFGDVVTVTAAEGFWFAAGEFSRKSRCGADGKWDPQSPEVIEIRCPAVPTWNGYNVSSEERAVGSNVSVSCTKRPAASVNVAPPETIDRKWQMTCGRKGRWLPDLPKCPDVSAEKVKIEATESRHGVSIGVVCVAVVSSLLTFVALADLPLYLSQLRNGATASLDRQ